MQHNLCVGMFHNKRDTCKVRQVDIHRLLVFCLVEIFLANPVKRNFPVILYH